MAIARIAGDGAETLEDVVEPHRVEPVKQGPRVVEHDAGLLARGDELRYELAHTLIAPVKNRGVVVVARIRMVHHVLEIADDLGPLGRLVRIGNQRLVHVQGDSVGALDIVPVDSAFGQENRFIITGRLGDRILRTGEIGQTVNVRG